MAAQKTNSNKEANRIPRPPVVTVMGHIDHGKSTLLDYIRKTNVVEGEAGGITQHLSAYEVEHTTRDGDTKKITFLDTPGHEAFSAMRSRGARAADVAILVVSAEDGVKPQTLEALGSIKEAGIPYIVAINKIDKPNANPEKTKQELAEHEVYAENYGGTVPVAEISAKVGTGVDDLLDLVLLAVELEELHGDPTALAEGVVIESHVDPRRGASAELIIMNGTLSRGAFVAADQSVAPTRMFENFLSEPIQSASFSSPVRITGFNTPPPVGAIFKTYASKKDLEKAISQDATDTPLTEHTAIGSDTEIVVIPVVIKTDVLGTTDAVRKVIEHIDVPRIQVRIVATGVGTIVDNDIRLAGNSENAIILGFGVAVDDRARDIAERAGATINTFTIIYELKDWLQAELERRAPKITIDERRGLVKILRTFSRNKDRQVIGGEVIEGKIQNNGIFKILRRDAEIGRGKIVEVQSQKMTAESVDEGTQCGLRVDAKTEIVPNDKLEVFVRMEQ